MPPINLVRGSGNVFRDLNLDDSLHEKAIIAAGIIKSLNEKGWSDEQAAKELNVPVKQIELIRKAELANISVDELKRIYYQLNK